MYNNVIKQFDHFVTLLRFKSTIRPWATMTSCIIFPQLCIIPLPAIFGELMLGDS
jgi:hypothetical protein